VPRLNGPWRHPHPRAVSPASPVRHARRRRPGPNPSPRTPTPELPRATSPEPVQSHDRCISLRKRAPRRSSGTTGGCDRQENTPANRWDRSSAAHPRTVPIRPHGPWARPPRRRGPVATAVALRTATVAIRRSSVPAGITFVPETELGEYTGIIDRQLRGPATHLACGPTAVQRRQTRSIREPVALATPRPDDGFGSLSGQ